MKVVCKKWTEDFEIDGYHIEDILSLVKEAYAQRAKEGISFTTLNYAIDDFLAERTDADYWFLAFDENKKLDGTARLTVKKNGGEICNFAVSPLCQGRHVGSELLQEANRFAKEHGLEYVMSWTAIRAKSSVRCHCNNGFRIIGIDVGLYQNYSSYIFRNQLAPSFYWNCIPLVKLRYLKSYLKYRLAKKPNGQNSNVGNLILALKEIKK